MTDDPEGRAILVATRGQIGQAFDLPHALAEECAERLRADGWEVSLIFVLGTALAVRSAAAGSS